MSCKLQKADPTQYPLCHCCVFLQQGIPSLPSGARRRSFRPAHCHFGGLFCCLLQCAAQLPLHGSAAGYCWCRYATHGRIPAKPERQKIPARHGIRQRPVGQSFGHCPLHRPGFLSEYPHDHDGAPDHGEPSKAAEVRPKQEYPGYRRQWFR